MRPKDPRLAAAQRLTETLGARGAVVLVVYEGGQWAVASYGETKGECAKLRKVNNKIADAIDAGRLEVPVLGEE